MLEISMSWAVARCKSWLAMRASALTVTLESNANFNAFGASAGSPNYTLTGSITLNGIAQILVGETNLIFSNPIGGAVVLCGMLQS